MGDLIYGLFGVHIAHVVLLVQRDNKQVLEKFEAFRKLASDLEELPSIQLGAADER